MVVIPIVVPLELLLEVLEAVKGVCGIEPFIVLPVTSFHLPVVPGCVWPDQLMLYPMCSQMFLKQGRLVPLCGETVGEFCPIICLNAFDSIREGLYQMLQEYSGGIGAVFLKCFHIPPAGVFVDGGVLIKFLPFCFIHETDGRDEFHINLHLLAGMIHLCIRLWDILGIRRMDRHNAPFSEEAIEAGDGALIITLSEFHPEDDETGIGIPSAHIGDKLDLLRGMLVGMMVRPSGFVPKGLDRAVKTFFPAVDILPVGLKLDGGLGDTIFFSVTDQG